MVSNCEHLAGVAAPKEGDNVHNDECTKCFVNPKSESGIQICLTCYNGGCDNHTKQHFNLTRHPVVMKYIKVRKPEEEIAEVEDPQKITKLAIGVEGGAKAESENDKYDVTTAIICYGCDPEGREVPKTDALEALCITVQMSSSASDKAQLNQWTAENYTSCPHTKSLKQIDAPDLSQRSLQHCNNCELADDLWLCLTCGSLGCARKNWDGSGGNNHGVDHNKQTGHPVVVKVGTITAEGTADLHCYACDNGVVDESLKEHLAHFKIDIATQEKTVLSTAERELQFNLEYDWAASYDSKGKKQLQLFGPNFCGLQNLGNSCYMASIIQTLFSFPIFRQRYLEEGQRHLLECPRSDPANCYQCQMAKLAHGLLSGEYSQEEKEDESTPTDMVDDGEEKQKDQKGIPPRMFKALITKNHAEFRGTQQQDASEFFTYLISEVEKAELVNNVDPSNMFKHKIEERWQCSECGGVNYKSTKHSQMTLRIPYDEEQVKREEEALQRKQNEKSKGASATSSSAEVSGESGEHQAKKKRKIEAKRMLSLHVISHDDTRQHKCERERKHQYLAVDLTGMEDDVKAAPVELDKCFDLWGEAEEVDKQCPTCNKNTKFKKSHRFETFPDTLVLTMHRFVYFDWVPRKLRTRLIVNDKVDLTKFTGKGLQEGETELPGEAGPSANAQIVDSLTAMGFPKIRCEHACINTQNVGVEQAMEWLMGHMDDPQYDLPINAKPSSSGGGGGASEGNIEMLMGMGFDRARATYALQETGDDVARATDWVFSHMDDPLPQQQQAADVEMEDARPPNYELVALVTHMGRSTSHGHYVAHVLKNGKWVFYNDQKVVLDEEPPRGDAYMYFYRKV